MNLDLLAKLLAAFLVVAPSYAWDRSSDSYSELPKSARIVKSRNAADPDPANSEVHRDVIIEAGKSLAFDSKLDYSTSDKVAVTVRCTTCDSLSNSMNLLVLQASWSVDGADLYTATETRAGSGFAYWDSGAAVFQVFGPQFRLILKNKGNQGIMVQQVTIFRVSR